MIVDKTEQTATVDKRWVTGNIFRIEIPADTETLLAGGADFLRRAFRAAGALGADNRVSRVLEAQEFQGGGTGKKLLLTVAYETPRPNLPEELFIKFSRNIDNELWDWERPHVPDSHGTRA